MTLPLWRSLLFVPALNETFVQSSLRRGADGIILDLEDSILPEQKAQARRQVEAAASLIHAAGISVLVRINAPLRLAVPDLEASIGPCVDAIVVPKAQGAQHLALLGEAMGELELAAGMALGATRVVAMVEDAAALAQMQALATAPRVVGLTLGAEDFSVSMDMQPTADALYVPNVLAVAAARAAGILPIGYLGSVAQMDDLDEYRVMVRRSRGLGFRSGFCIHPRQVGILNEEFSPGAQELARAQEIIDAFEQSARTGAGAFRLNGRMIDKPVVDRAKAVLEQQAAIAARATR